MYKHCVFPIHCNLCLLSSPQSSKCTNLNHTVNHKLADATFYNHAAKGGQRGVDEHFAPPPLKG